MPEFLTNYNLMPFHLSLIAVVLLGMAETIGYYINLRPTTLFKKLSPKHLDDLPLLNVKFSKTLIIFFLLMNFSFAGYFLQFCIYAREMTFFPAYYLMLPALIIAIFFTVFMIHCLDQVIPTKRIKRQVNLLGRLATISSGNARPGFSAQARVRDEYGQLHYVQVEPEFGELEFQSQVILIRPKKSHYIAKRICPSNRLFNLDLGT
ncbi:YqiJ family protein [Acinetobacter johnsonii]|nr:YqiJ family protein [Acinetobacter johnsonii]